MSALRFLSVLTVASMATAGAAVAQDCRSSSSAVSGTLTAPQAPCNPPARPLPFEQQREKREERGVFRSGNTTIHFGGGVQAETGVRGR